jgi:hypothetical protein
MCRVHRKSLAKKKRLDLALKSFNAQDEPFIKNKIKKENAGHVLGVLNARPPSKYPPSSISIFQQVLLQLNARL